MPSMPKVRASSGMMVVFIEGGDIVEDVFLLLEHPPQAVLDDHRQLIGEGGIVGHAIGDELGEQQAVAILMLQTFTGQRRAPGSTADQKAPRPLVAGRPGQIADALEAEHRIVDVERNHVDAMVAVSGAGGDP